MSALALFNACIKVFEDVTFTHMQETLSLVKWWQAFKACMLKDDSHHEVIIKNCSS